MVFMTNNSLYFGFPSANVRLVTFAVPPAYYAHLAAFRARYYIEGGDTSESGSSGGNPTREQNVEVRPLPVIKDNVKDVMFYCWMKNVIFF